MLHFQSYTLRRRHAVLDHQIGEEHKRPAPDTLKLQALKRERLSVKERLSALEVQPLAYA